jgi:hypothetical protein
MKKKKIFVVLCVLCVLCAFPVLGQTSSLALLFPQLNQEQHAQALTNEGLFLYGSRATGQRLAPTTKAGIAVMDPIRTHNPLFLAESIRVLPVDKAGGLLKVYNSLSRVRALAGITYHSATRNKNIPLFEEASRVEGLRKINTKLPDPPSARAVPGAETLYVRLDDANFGNSYYECKLVSNENVIRYTLTNFKPLTYLFITAIPERRFISQLYFEFVNEGLVVYSVVGADASDFVASMMDIPSAIEKRLNVFINWVEKGINVP